jgi:type I restriction enzyme S subunit
VFIEDNGKWPRCRDDDVLVGRYGASVGKICTGKSGAYNVALVKMIFDRKIVSPRFLFFWLSADVFQETLQMVSRSAQNGFNKGDLKETLFWCPELSEQKRVVHRIEAAFARIDRMVEDATRAAHLLDRLDQRLLAKAFRGELVPQDPNDEPAAELLARIKATRAAAPKPKRGRRQRA